MRAPKNALYFILFVLFWSGVEEKNKINSKKKVGLVSKGLIYMNRIYGLNNPYIMTLLIGTVIHLNFNIKRKNYINLWPKPLNLIVLYYILTLIQNVLPPSYDILPPVLIISRL